MYGLAYLLRASLEANIVIPTAHYYTDAQGEGEKELRQSHTEKRAVASGGLSVKWSHLAPFNNETGISEGPRSAPQNS